MRATAILAAVATAAAASAGQKIQDNSFLIEEAYNQEDAVIQHIQTFQWNRTARSWQYSFTEEWPTPHQNHQMSITVPVFKATGLGSGLGDILLNYRYQAVLTERLAFAPRLSLVLDTGRWERGYGKGSPGVQVSLPVSADLSGLLTMHLNLGATWTPNAVGAPGVRHGTVEPNAGASLVFQASPTFNPLVEVVGARVQSVRPDGSVESGHVAFVNPGVRFAINRPSGLQIVPGLAYTIGVGPSSGTRSVFLYLSFEHPLRALRGRP